MKPLPVIFGVIVLALLIFGIFRGCHNANKTSEINKELLGKLAASDEKNKKDSIARIESAKHYQDTIDTQNAFITINENKLAAAELDLDKANDRINSLLAKYRPIKPEALWSIDTLVGGVSADTYIKNCVDCFAELGGQQERIKVARAEWDNTKQSLDAKINTQQNRINELGKETTNLQVNLSNIKTLSRDFMKRNLPRAKFYFSMGAMSINSIIPNAAGLGGAYQDKRNRMFAFRYYTSEYKSVYAVDLYMPLSFK